MSETAILIGSSGLVGNEVLRILLAEAGGSISSYKNFRKVKIFVRKPLPFEHPNLEQYVVNFDAIENYRELIKGDVLFCCLGTTIKMAGSKDAFKKVDYKYPLEFAKIAKQNGVEKLLLISSMGADETSTNFYLKVKGDIERALEKLEFKSLIILRPSMLLGDRKEFRFGESVGKVFMKLFSFAFIGSLKKYKALESTIVAKAMLKLSKSEFTGINVCESDKLRDIGGN